MDALISARMRLAILLYDNGKMLKIDDQGLESHFSSMDLNYLLGDANDFHLMQSTSEEKVMSALRRSVEADKALFFLLNILQGDVGQTQHIDWYEVVDRLIPIKHVAQHLCNVLYARPLPKEVVKKIDDGFASGYRYLSLFIGNLSRLQPVVSAVRDGWYQIPDETFGARTRYCAIQKELVASGHFRYKVNMLTHAFDVADICSPVSSEIPLAVEEEYAPLVKKWDSYIVSSLPPDVIAKPWVNDFRDLLCSTVPDQNRQLSLNTFVATHPMITHTYDRNLNGNDSITRGKQSMLLIPFYEAHEDGNE